MHGMVEGSARFENAPRAVEMLHERAGQRERRSDGDWIARRGGGRPLHRGAVRQQRDAQVADAKDASTSAEAHNDETAPADDAQVDEKK